MDKSNWKRKPGNYTERRKDREIEWGTKRETTNAQFEMDPGVKQACCGESGSSLLYFIISSAAGGELGGNEPYSSRSLETYTAFPPEAWVFPTIENICIMQHIPPQCLIVTLSRRMTVKQKGQARAASARRTRADVHVFYFLPKFFSSLCVGLFSPTLSS